MLPIKAVAEVLGVSVNAVRNAIKRAGIEPTAWHRNAAMFNSDAIDKIKAAL